MVDSLGGDEQLCGDLGVCVVGADQVEYLLLTPGQAPRMVPRRDRTTGPDQPRDQHIARFSPRLATSKSEPSLMRKLRTSGARLAFTAWKTSVPGRAAVKLTYRGEQHVAKIG